MGRYKIKDYQCKCVRPIAQTRQVKLTDTGETSCPQVFGTRSNALVNSILAFELLKTGWGCLGYGGELRCCHWQ